MAKIQANPLRGKKTEIPHTNKDTLEDIYKRAYKTLNVPKEIDLSKYFHIFVNGHRIDKAYWPRTRPKDGAEVLIAMLPDGGDFGSFVKIGAILAISVLAAPAAAALLGGTVATMGAGGYLLAAGLGLAGTLLINALIPVENNAARGAGFTNYEDSQMYSITSQSNSAKKYGNVPKVYGTFRVFPNIVNAPYTQTEADPNTGKRVQFLYAVYDFGLGPLAIEDIRIGETELSEYQSVEYRLVDPNKPVTSEGLWDEVVEKEFTLYKGDVDPQNISVNLNRVDQPIEVIRNASANQNNVKQEILLNFVFPQGLTTFGTDGSRIARTVELKVEFAEIGTNDWKLFDDYNEVELSPDRSFFGAFVNYDDYNVDDFTLLEDRNYSPDSVYSPNYINPENIILYSAGEYGSYVNGNYYYKRQLYGIKENLPFIIYLSESLPVDTEVSVNSQSLGRVVSVGAPVSGFYPTTFNSVPRSVVLFARIQRFLNNNTLDEETAKYITRTGNDRLIRVIPSGRFVTTANTQNAYFTTMTFTPRTKQSLKIRITRTTSYGGATYQILDDLTWVDLNTRFQTNTVNTTKRHVFLEMKIKATDQLNGNVQTLNAICTSVLDQYDPNTDTWSKGPSSNPAWVFVDLLTGEVNKRAIDKSRLELDSISEWAEFCDEVPTAPVSFTDGFFNERFRCNFLLDYTGTLQQVLQQVSSAAQASLNVVNGKYGVLIDKLKTIPVQVFTPRNSWDFRSNRRYVTPPHALKISYVDPGSGWELKEAVVYDDGYDATTAETFEEIKTFACTNPEQAWRYGRYMLAQGRLRQENIQITVDFEHLVCTRGDYVLLTQDIMRVGGVPARVRSVSGNTVTIDDEFTTEPLVNYGYTFRSKTGQFTTDTMTITGPSTADLDGNLPEVGDLIIWGEISKITIDCLVKEIQPNQDLSATLILVEKADAVHDAESTDTLPIYDPQISRIQGSDLSAPGSITDLAVDETSYDCVNNQYEYFVDLSWKGPVDNVYELFEIYVDINGQGYELFDTSRTESYRYIVSVNDLGLLHKFKILAVNSRGIKITLGETVEISETPSAKTDPPSNVDLLALNITNETLQIEWKPVADCDIDVYQIRYSPNKDATWDQTTILMNANRNQTMVFTQARTGAYFIKAIDWAGNESVTAKIAKTSIPELVNLNVISETNDFPTFPGTLDRVQSLFGALILQEEIPGPVGVLKYYDDGEYFYQGLLDLGEIYTCRIQSLIEAEGYTPDDLMANWVTLASVTQLSTVGTGSQWDVETYVRGTDEFNVMAEWTTLASIDPISEGVQTNFTSWQKFTIGDFTARIFQFKLRLISNSPSVTPRVFDAKIKADMPDRIISGENISAPDTGYRVDFEPFFKGPTPSPSIGITQDNASQGDYYTITNKSTLGFDIQFYDKDNIAVARTFDYQAKGFGKSNFEVVDS